MISGFQVGAFQTNFQQGVVVRTVLVTEDVGGGWEDYVKEKNDQKLRRELRTQERQLKKVEKKIANVEKKLAKHPEGILANLHRLEARREEIKTRIREIRIEFDFPVFDDDEDDIEALLLDS